MDAVWHKAPVTGWRWQRESQLLVQGQTVMTPDFTLYHPGSDTMVYVEVVGFWTPEYLEEKCRRLKQFVGNRHVSTRPAETVRWLLMVSENLKPDDQSRFAELGIPIVSFGKKSTPQAWINAIG